MDSLPLVIPLGEVPGEVREQVLQSGPLGVRESAERLGGLRVPLVPRLEGEDREPAAAVELRRHDAEQVLQRHVAGLGPADVAEPPGGWIAVLDHLSTLAVPMRRKKGDYVWLVGAITARDTPLLGVLGTCPPPTGVPRG